MIPKETKQTKLANQRFNYFTKKMEISIEPEVPKKQVTMKKEIKPRRRAGEEYRE